MLGVILDFDDLFTSDVLVRLLSSVDALDEFVSEKIFPVFPAFLGWSITSAHHFCHKATVSTQVIVFDRRGLGIVVVVDDHHGEP